MGNRMTFTTFTRSPLNRKKERGQGTMMTLFIKNMNETREDRIQANYIDGMANSQAEMVCRLGALKKVQVVIDETADEETFWTAPKYIRFMDASGQYAEICFLNTLHTWRMEADEQALNKVLNHFNLLPGGKIIGINWTINEALDHLWKQIPTEKKQVIRWGDIPHDDINMPSFRVRQLQHAF